MNKAGWVKKTVRSLITHHMSGPSPTCEERNISDSNEWGLLKTTAVIWSGWNPNAHKVPPKIYWNNSKIQVRTGDVIVTKAGPRERVGVVVYVDSTPPNLMVSGKMIGLRPDKCVINGRVLASILSSDQSQRYLDARTTGMADSQLNFANNLLLEMEVDVPPVEQHQYMGQLISLLNIQIKKTEALIEKYQQIKAGLMHDLFTRGIGADGKLRPPREQAPELYQQTPIGWIPKEWEPLKLKEILQTSGGYLQTGPFGSQLHAHEYTYEGVPVVMPQDINDGVVDEVQIARIEERRAQSLNKHRLRIGDVIIARRGELSRSAAITGQEKGWVCGTGCFLLRLGGSDLDARFFSHMYRHELVQRQVVGLAVGSTMPSLNNEIMGKLIFPYMSKKEQTAIADKVELTETRIITLNSEFDKLFKQKSGLMHDLLTGKVQVNVDQPEAAHAL